MRAEKHLARAIREHATRSLASANFGALGEVVNDAPLVVRVIGTGHVLEYFGPAIAALSTAALPGLKSAQLAATTTA